VKSIVIAKFTSRDAPDTGTDLAGYPANPKAGYPVRQDTGYSAGFSEQNLNGF
jgi:hypothetical protein